MNQEAADRTLAILGRRGWHQAAVGVSPSYPCLGIALGVARSGAGSLTDIRSAIRDLFPGRLASSARSPGEDIFAFNDHPATTFEDVQLVIKHAITDKEPDHV